MALIIGARRHQTPQEEDNRSAAQRAQDYIDGQTGAAATARTGERHALGVPDDYQANVPRMYTARYAHGFSGGMTSGMGKHAGYGYQRVNQEPRYYDGDEMRPASQGTAAIIRKQQALVIAGLLDPYDYRPGAWDPPTIKAYKQLLEFANAAGLSEETALYRYAQAGIPPGGGGQDGSGGGGQFLGFDENGNPIFGPDPKAQFVAPAMPLTLTNKTDLKRVFRQAVIDTLGEGWSQAQIDELVDAYGWQEIKLQAEAYQSEVTRLEQEFNFQQGLGPAPTQKQVTKVTMPDPVAYAEEEIRRRDPAGAQATDIAEDYAPEFFQALGGYV